MEGILRRIDIRESTVRLTHRVNRCTSQPHQILLRGWLGNPGDAHSFHIHFRLDHTESVALSIPAISE
jgi:hypothetical protein